MDPVGEGVEHYLGGNILKFGITREVRTIRQEEYWGWQSSFGLKESKCSELNDSRRKLNQMGGLRKELRHLKKRWEETGKKKRAFKST